MVNAADIHDEKSLEEWLNDQPREIAIWIATRSALRVGPKLWGETAPAAKVDLKSLRFLRTLLVSEHVVIKRTPEVGDTLSLVSNAAYHSAAAVSAPSSDYSVSAYTAAAATASVSGTIASSSDASCSAFSAEAVAAAAESADSARKIIWSEVTDDAVAVVNTKVPLVKSLWSGENPFEPDPWQYVRREWKNAGPGWQFWIDWYAAILSGRQLNPNMLEEIALIDHEVWVMRADHVNEIIAGIVLSFAVDSTPNAEEIDLDDKNEFFSVPITTIRPELFRDAKEKVLDTVAEIRTKADFSPNQFSALISDIDRIEENCTRYGDRPLRIHDLFEKSKIHLEEKLHSGELAPDELVRDLIHELDTGGIDIRRSDEEVAKTVKARVAVRSRRITIEKKQQLAIVVDAASKEARADMRVELEEDAEGILSDNNNNAEAEESRFRLLSRLSRMAKRRKDDAVKLADDAYKIDRGTDIVGDAAKKAADTAPQWWDSVNSLFTNLFG